MRCRSSRCTSHRCPQSSMLDHFGAFLWYHLVRFRKLVLETPTTADGPHTLNTGCYYVYDRRVCSGAIVRVLSIRRDRGRQRCAHFASKLCLVRLIVAYCAKRRTSTIQQFIIISYSRSGGDANAYVVVHCEKLGSDRGDAKNPTF